MSKKSTGKHSSLAVYRLINRLGVAFSPAGLETIIPCNVDAPPVGRSVSLYKLARRSYLVSVVSCFPLLGCVLNGL